MKDGRMAPEIVAWEATRRRRRRRKSTPTDKWIDGDLSRLPRLLT